MADAPPAPDVSEPSRSVIERAEELYERLSRRVQPGGPESTDNGETATRRGAAESPSPNEPPLERADEMLAQAGERLGEWSAWAGQQLRKAVALAWEEAEDMVAEAQHLRQRST